MANNNTKFARNKGYSDMKRLRSGKSKNYGKHPKPQSKDK